jgi:hypothetical protein
MYHGHRRYRCLTLVPIIILLGVAPEVAALPRYSAQYGQSCHLCHTNPTGGGQRNLYATQYIVPSELTITRLPEEEMEQLNPQIAPNLLVGLDQRTIWHEGEGEEGRSSLFAMQADVYLAFQLNRKFSAYFDLGQTRTQEYFGMAYIFPAHGYFKVGRFMPDFGWRTADHQIATRRYLLFPEGSDFPSSFIDSGLEVGFSAWRIDLTASLQGGSGNNGDSYTGRAVWRHSFGSLNLALGGSYLQRNQNDLDRSAYGGFGYLAWKPLIWFWEVDETRRQPASEAEVKGLLVTQELAVIVRQGVYLLLTYSFQDPDREFTTGTRSRWGVGVDTLIYPFFGMQLMGNYYAFEEGLAVQGNDYLQAELIFHFLY